MTMRVQQLPDSDDAVVKWDVEISGAQNERSQVFDNLDEAIAWARERCETVFVEDEEGQFMPWTPKDATRHTKKANTAKKQRQWSDVSNSAMKRGLSEGAAIREANAVVGREAKKKTAKKGK